MKSLYRFRSKAAGLVLCMLGLSAVTQARAEIIFFTITTNGVTLGPFGGSGETNTVDVNTVNAALMGIGSQFRFTSLSGTSNFPGGAFWLGRRKRSVVSRLGSA